MYIAKRFTFYLIQTIFDINSKKGFGTLCEKKHLPLMSKRLFIRDVPNTVYTLQFRFTKQFSTLILRQTLLSNSIQIYMCNILMTIFYKYTCIYIYTYVHIHIYIHTHIHINIYIYIHIHTHKHIYFQDIFQKQYTLYLNG